MFLIIKNDYICFVIIIPENSFLVYLNCNYVYYISFPIFRYGIILINLKMLYLNCQEKYALNGSEARDPSKIYVYCS